MITKKTLSHSAFFKDIIHPLLLNYKLIVFSILLALFLSNLYIFKNPVLYNQSIRISLLNYPHLSDSIMQRVLKDKALLDLIKNDINPNDSFQIKILNAISNPSFGDREKSLTLTIRVTQNEISQANEVLTLISKFIIEYLNSTHYSESDKINITIKNLTLLKIELNEIIKNLTELTSKQSNNESTSLLYSSRIKALLELNNINTELLNLRSKLDLLDVNATFNIKAQVYSQKNVYMINLAGALLGFMFSMLIVFSKEIIVRVKI